MSWNKIAIEFIVDDMINSGACESTVREGVARECNRSILLELSLGPSFDNLMRYGLDMYATEVAQTKLYEFALKNYGDYFYDYQKNDRSSLLHNIKSDGYGMLFIGPEREPYYFSDWVKDGRPYIDHRNIIRVNTKQPADAIFPAMGVYIYYHPYEGYKIGKAENVPRRMDKHWCSAPASRLLHVIETDNLAWCEGFIQGKFERWRRHANHEYFDLNPYHLMWLFSIDVLNRPKSIGDQLSLLDLL